MKIKAVHMAHRYAQIIEIDNEGQHTLGIVFTTDDFVRSKDKVEEATGEIIPSKSSYLNISNSRRNADGGYDNAPTYIQLMDGRTLCIPAMFISLFDAKDNRRQAPLLKGFTVTDR